jgi:hypothetical protein
MSAIQVSYRPPQSIKLTSDIDDFEPGNLLIPILEELTEVLPSEVWRELWTWVEVRKKRFTQVSE